MFNLDAQPARTPLPTVSIEDIHDPFTLEGKAEGVYKQQMAGVVPPLERLMHLFVYRESSRNKVAQLGGQVSQAAGLFPNVAGSAMLPGWAFSRGRRPTRTSRWSRSVRLVSGSRVGSISTGFV